MITNEQMCKAIPHAMIIQRFSQRSGLTQEELYFACLGLASVNADLLKRSENQMVMDLHEIFLSYTKDINLPGKNAWEEEKLVKIRASVAEVNKAPND